MKKLVFAYPGDLETPTGGYRYDRRIVAGLRDLGWQVDLLPLGQGFPFPDKETLAAALKAIAGLPAGTLVVVDGLAFGAMAGAAAALSGHVRLIALVHHPLCLENGLSPEQARELKESEMQALVHARHVIVTSPATAVQVRDLFDVAEKDVTDILPGTDLPNVPERPSSGSVRLLSVGTVVPRKGYDLLFKALSSLAGLEWHLDIVGGLEADPDCYTSLLQQAKDQAIAGRITFHGAVSQEKLAEYYRSADIFVLASRYEGYGMAYTEAMAWALPVIGSGDGAVRETLPEGAAIYCETENVDALRRALEGLIVDRDKRTDMAAAARRSAAALPGWDGASARFAAVLQEVGE